MGTMMRIIRVLVWKCIEPSAPVCRCHCRRSESAAMRAAAGLRWLGRKTSSTLAARARKGFSCKAVVCFPFSRSILCPSPALRALCGAGSLLRELRGERKGVGGVGGGGKEQRWGRASALSTGVAVLEMRYLRFVRCRLAFDSGAAARGQNNIGRRRGPRSWPAGGGPCDSLVTTGEDG